MSRALAVLLLPLFAVLPAFAEDELPYPKGSTSQTHAGLKFQLVIPNDYDPAKEHSLVVVLHGSGGTETGMAGSLQPLAKEGFVVCAPKSAGSSWTKPDIDLVKVIVKHLDGVLSIGKGRMHSMGFSAGGWALAPLAFDEKLHFVSACWVAAGYKGGKVPKRARKEMGAMALAGSEDANRGAAEKTVDLLKDKVRTVECHIQQGIGHEFPRKLMPYYFYWVKVMEGRFVPGEDLSFEWTSDVEAAKSKMAARKLGGLFYFYSPGDAEDAEAKRCQHEVFFHPLVRRFGKQLVAVKLEKESHEELFASLKLKKTPGVAVLKPDFEVSRTYEGKIKTSKLAKSLRALARDKSMPR